MNAPPRPWPEFRGLAPTAACSRLYESWARDAKPPGPAGSGLLLAAAFFLLRHLLALLAGFRQADGDGLLAAFHLAAFAALAAFELAPLLFLDRLFHVLAGAFGVFSSHGSSLVRSPTDEAAHGSKSETPARPRRCNC